MATQSSLLTPPFFILNWQPGVSDEPNQIKRTPCHATGEGARSNRLSVMNVERIPTFTGPATRLWASVPADAKRRLLANVLCGDCHQVVSIRSFTGSIRQGDLLLTGRCSECGGAVARLIEMD